jgi:hypothetical protein
LSESGDGVQPDARGPELGEPKTDRYRRVEPLPRSAVTTLDAHRKRQSEEALTAAGSWLGNDLVVTTEIGVHTRASKDGQRRIRGRT